MTRDLSTEAGKIMFCYSSRRRHTRCLSDWSSDVCSSDLGFSVGMMLAMQGLETLKPYGAQSQVVVGIALDRKSVVQGKSVDLGGRRIIKKKKRHIRKKIIYLHLHIYIISNSNRFYRMLSILTLLHESLRLLSKRFTDKMSVISGWSTLSTVRKHR